MDKKSEISTIFTERLRYYHRKLLIMPRRSKEERIVDRDSSEDDENEVNSSQSSVANVNKREESGGQDKSSKKNAKTRSKKGQRTPVKCNKKWNGTPCKGKPKRRKKVVSENEEEQSDLGDQEVQAELMDENQIVRVTVNAGPSPDKEEDSVVQLNAEDSEDGEIEFRESKVANGSEEILEGSKDAEGSSAERSKVKQGVDRNDDRIAATSVGRRRQLQEIDREMKEKIQELHQLMSQGGLRESAELLEKCLPKEGMLLNLNDNASMNKGQKDKVEFEDEVEIGSMARSAETIYDSAVPKRNSSLSEDDLMINSEENSPEFCQKNRDQAINVFISEMDRRDHDRRRVGRNDRYHYTQDEFEG